MRRRRGFVERYGRKLVVGVLGGLVTTAGVAMLVVPGPGIAVTLVGLAILATEFRWARRAQRWLKAQWRRAVVRARRERARREQQRRRGPRVDVGSA